MASFPAYFEAVMSRNQEPHIPPRQIVDSWPDKLEYAGDPISAPWLRDESQAGRAGVTTRPRDRVLVELGDSLPQLGSDLADPGRLFTGLPDESVDNADAVAIYRPWHFFRDEWGIEIYEHNLLRFTHQIAEAMCESPYLLAPIVFRQVLEHEYAHFDFEVIATRFEDVTADPCYREYCLSRYALRVRDEQTGPLEEAIATWREVVFARRTRGVLGPASSRYAKAVEMLSREAPSGYRDWPLLQDPKTRGSVVCDLCGGCILGYPFALEEGGWWRSTRTHRAEVPLRWMGEHENLKIFGAREKEWRRPTIKELERWLKSTYGASITRGKGSHRHYDLGNGVKGTYSTSAGHLLRPEAKQLAAKLEFPTDRELCIAILQGA